MITSPRKWTSGTSAQVCFSFSGEKSDADQYEISVKSQDEKEYIMPSVSFKLPPGKTNFVMNFRNSEKID